MKASVVLDSSPALEQAPAWTPRRLILLAGVGLVLLLAAAIVVDTARTVVRLRSPYPVIDEWDNIAVYRDWIEGRTSTLQAFLAPNYEHRIAIPRLILFSDYRFFGGRGTLDLLVIFATQGLQAALLVGWLWSKPASRLGGLLVASAVVGLTFSLRQWHNFIWGFQVQFVGVYALASLGILLFVGGLVSRNRGGRGTLLLVAGYAGALAATFTMASGMLVGPVMVALAILWRAEWRIILLTAAVTLACAAAYRTGLDLQPGFTIGDSLGRLGQPARLIAFTAIDLGNLQGRSMLAARWLGYGAFAIAGLVVVTAMRRGKRDAMPFALVGIMLFCLASALMTAVGRLGYGMEQALSSRYATGTGLFWSSVLAYGWCVASEKSGSRAWRAAIYAGGLGLLCCAAWAGRDGRTDVENWSQVQRRAADLTLTGLTLGSSDPDDGSLGLEPQIDFLRRQRLSVFSLPEGFAAGRPLTSAGPIAPPDRCHGAATSAAAIPEQADLQGVAITGVVDRPQTTRIYIADGAGTIVGFASVTTHPARVRAWEGFARVPAGTPLSAFVRLADGGLCYLGTAIVTESRSASVPRREP